MSSMDIESITSNLINHEIVSGQNDEQLGLITDEEQKSPSIPIQTTEITNDDQTYGAYTEVPTSSINRKNMKSNSNAAFQTQFIRHKNDKLKLTMDKLDELIIDPETINQHYSMDIIICILYILSLISSILCLMLLYGQYPVYFYIILSILIIGALLNLLVSFAITAEIIEEYLESKPKIMKIMIFVGNALLGIMIQPIISLLWRKCIQKEKDSERLIWCWQYFLMVSLPQSFIMMVVVLKDDNIYFILLLIISILSTLFMLWCLFEPHMWPIIPIPSSEQKGHSFILYVAGLIIDYFAIFFVIIYSFYSFYYSTNFVLKLYLYNAICGVLLISYPNAYHEKQLYEGRNGSCSKVVLKSTSFLYFFMMYILTCIGMEAFCVTIINILYNEFKRKQIRSGMDWNVLVWIISSFKKKERIKRLCIVNGVTIDLYRSKYENSTSDQKLYLEQTNQTYTDSLLQQYIVTNCKNNFENVSFKQLKHYRTEQANIDNMIPDYMDSLYGSDDNKLIVVFRYIAIGLFIITRIIKYILFPMIITVVFKSNHLYNKAISIVLIIQFLCMIAGLILMIIICTEIYYSLYFVAGNGTINDLVRKKIGYYYNTMSIHELHEELTQYFPTGIVDIIIIYAKPITLTDLLYDEQIIINKAFQQIDDETNVSQNDFDHLMAILPKRYKMRLEKTNKSFDDLSDNNGTIDCEHLRQIINILGQLEAQDMEFNNSAISIVTTNSLNDRFYF